MACSCGVLFLPCHLTIGWHTCTEAIKTKVKKVAVTAVVAAL